MGCPLTSTQVLSHGTLIPLAHKLILNKKSAPSVPGVSCLHLQRASGSSLTNASLVATRMTPGCTPSCDRLGGLVVSLRGVYHCPRSHSRSGAGHGLPSWVSGSGDPVVFLFHARGCHLLLFVGKRRTRKASGRSRGNPAQVSMSSMSSCLLYLHSLVPAPCSLSQPALFSLLPFVVESGLAEPRVPS